MRGLVLEQIVGGIPGTQRTVGQVIPRCWDRHGFLGRIWSEWDHCVAHTVASIWAGLVADTRHTLCFRHRLLIREVGSVECLTGANPHTRHHRNVALSQVCLARSDLQSCGSDDFALVLKPLELRSHSDYCICCFLRGPFQFTNPPLNLQMSATE